MAEKVTDDPRGSLQLSIRVSRLRPSGEILYTPHVPLFSSIFDAESPHGCVGGARDPRESERTLLITMLRFAFILLGVAALSFAARPATAAAASAARGASPKPNIVLILADDLGYGDVACFNRQSKIPTPHLDALAREGMRFTDAHAAGALCVPSRYGLMTGRYPFRNTGNRQPQKGPLIEQGRPTLATVLRSAGYATAMVGKWHLGFEGGDRFDCAKPLRGGPVDHGFDSFFGQHASLDIPPYFFIADDRCVEPPTADIAARSTPGWSPIQGAFLREGKIAPGYRPEEVHDVYTRKAIQYLDTHASRPAGDSGGPDPGRPFLLYLALTAPHTPWLPGDGFSGRSGAGLYGDFVVQVDDAVGQVLRALERHKLAENTLVIFTSDNGPVWYPADREKFGHAAVGPFRGMKSDVWEGGHRMPFIARWPGRVAPGTTTSTTVSFTDVFATAAEIAGAKIPAGAAEDSTSLLPLLRGDPKTFRRPPVIAASGSGVLTIRDGPWKYIPQLGSGGFTAPARISPQPGEPSGQLYHLGHDPAEQNNLFAAEPEIVQRLESTLRALHRPPTTPR